MPPAARLTDMHVCPMVSGTVPHVGGPVAGPGAPTVLIGALPAARVGDKAVCIGPPDVIAKGSATVFISGAMAARIGDMTAHGGVIVAGLPTVMIGDAGGGGGGGGGGASGSAVGPLLAATELLAMVETLVASAVAGAPFCEQCFKAALERARE